MLAVRWIGCVHLDTQVRETVRRLRCSRRGRRAGLPVNSRQNRNYSARENVSRRHEPSLAVERHVAADANTIAGGARRIQQQS